MLRRLALSLALPLALAAVALAPPHASAEEEAWTKLLAPADLAALGEAPLVLDIRDPKAYATAHIPGAVNAPYHLWRGPAQNPGEPLSEARATELLNGLGVRPERPVVVVHAGTDQTDFGAAARVYWTLKTAGVARIAILNGGVRSWVAAGRALSVTPTAPSPVAVAYAFSDAWTADRDAVAAAVSGSDPARLVDARPDAFHKAAAKHPAAAAAGTLPGAQSLPFEGWFDGASTEIAPAERIRALAEAAGVGEGAPVVSFCNTGHWAATNWFAMSELAGLDDVKLYPESMVGWTKAGGPVAKGE